MTTTKSEYKKIREELIKKDPAVLADALLSLAVQDERAASSRLAKRIGSD